MIEIIPAVIPKSFLHLSETLSRIAPHASHVQIDVCDGVFVPNKSWPYITTPDNDFTRIIKEEEGFPYWDKVSFEIDLMVDNPVRAADEWVRAGAERIIVHFESFESVELAEKFILDFKNKFYSEGSVLNISLGLAVNIDTPNESFEKLVQQVDFLQCMGIKKIGYQGEPFDERVLDKISYFHTKYPNIPISVDGGVNLDSASKLREVGATRLVAGSVILKSDDIAGTIDILKGE